MMTINRSATTGRIARLMMAPLIAGAIVATVPVAAHARDNAEKAEDALERENADKAVSFAERAVVETPRDPEMRVLLGQAYLKAGRMNSARQSLAAAVELGDASPRTALMLALAQVGSGEPRLAVGTINMQGSAIPAADRGLALALAGETARGVEIIASDIRAGNNTPKTRQNLAYAFALDGRWREARAMAQQDVPAGEIGDRMTEWASTARPDLYAQRIAALMGTDAVDDRGMPQHLALSNSAPVMPEPVAEPKPAPRMAEAAPVPTPVVASKPAPAAKPEPAPMSEPVVAEEPAAAPAPVAVAEVKPAPAPEPVAAPKREPALVSLAVIQPAKPDPADRPSSHQAPKPVVVATLPASSAAARPATSTAPKPAAPAAAAPKTAPAPARTAQAAPKPALPTPAASGSHIAQLGSYASTEAAQAGWKVFQSRYSNLRGAQPVITKATVDGKDYWRVAAGGFDAKGANEMCRAVKAGGNGCIPIAQANGASAPKARLAKAD